MHRIESAEQVDETTVNFQAKMWGISKRFEAEIVEQRPDKRIEWNVTDGYAHTGVVTFHPLSDNLTRIDLSLDIQPSNLIDKASRGMRFAKRAVRGDLHRFKAYVELDEDDKDGWRGTIEDGEVKRRSSSSSSGSKRSANGSDPSKPSRSRREAEPWQRTTAAPTDEATRAPTGEARPSARVRTTSSRTTRSSIRRTSRTARMSCSTCPWSRSTRSTSRSTICARRSRSWPRFAGWSSSASAPTRSWARWS